MDPDATVLRVNSFDEEVVGGGERMGHFGGPEWARPPRDDGGESVGNPTKLIKFFPAVSS
jgi:hypothetical protein